MKRIKIVLLVIGIIIAFIGFLFDNIERFPKLQKTIFPKYYQITLILNDLRNNETIAVIGSDLNAIGPLIIERFITNNSDNGYKINIFIKLTDGTTNRGIIYSGNRNALRLEKLTLGKDLFGYDYDQSISERLFLHFVCNDSNAVFSSNNKNFDIDNGRFIGYVNSKEIQNYINDLLNDRYWIYKKGLFFLGILIGLISSLFENNSKDKEK
jgi:hypothetical protein